MYIRQGGRTRAEMFLKKIGPENFCMLKTDFWQGRRVEKKNGMLIFTTGEIIN